MKEAIRDAERHHEYNSDDDAPRGVLDYAGSDADSFAEFERGYDKMIAAHTEE